MKKKALNICLLIWILILGTISIFSGHNIANPANVPYKEGKKLNRYEIKNQILPEKENLISIKQLKDITTISESENQLTIFTGQQQVVQIIPYLEQSQVQP